jgi:Ca-activated chloride channel family protein
LYRIDVGKEVFYAIDDSERRAIMDRIEAEKKKGTPTDPTFELSASLRSALPLADVQSESHALTATTTQDEHELMLARGSEPMDRDFVLSWKLANQSAPASEVYVDSEDEQRFAMLTLHPPSSEASGQTPPRDLIFVIDTSGSMAGESMRAAKEALQAALATLNPDDRFNIIRFDTQTEMLSESLLAVDRFTLLRAGRFIGRLEADGGTEMANALRLALAGQTEGRLRQVVFLTDGSVSNERELARLIESRLGEARLFPVAIGSAPNRHFLNRAASRGRGILTHITQNSDITREIAVLSEKLAQPVLTDIRILDAADDRALTDSPVDDLYREQSKAVFLDLPPQTQAIRVTGMLGEQPWTEHLTLPREARTQPAIASLWATHRITELLDDQWLHDEPEQHRPEITSLSLRYGVLSPYTAFLAIDATPARPTDITATDEKVANLLPAGLPLHAEALALPQTGLGLRFKLLIAGLLLIASFQSGLFRNPCT